MTAIRKQIQTRLVASRSLACRAPSTTAASANVPKTKSRAAIRPHWTVLSRPAPSPMPQPAPAATSARTGGVQRGSRACLRETGSGLPPLETAGRSVVMLMQRLPSTPCGGR